MNVSKEAESLMYMYQIDELKYSLAVLEKQLITACADKEKLIRRQLYFEMQSVMLRGLNCFARSDADISNSINDMLTYKPNTILEVFKK